LVKDRIVRMIVTAMGEPEQFIFFHWWITRRLLPIRSSW
jgi:hypothetical protein